MQMVGKLVDRAAASVPLSHTRHTLCPRLRKPTASVTTDGQSPPPRALMSATIEKGPARGASRIGDTIKPPAMPCGRDQDLTRWPLPNELGTF